MICTAVDVIGSVTVVMSTVLLGREEIVSPAMILLDSSD